ncbi:hypothetical protein INR49_024663, partial [Caranx melampygus]
MARFSSGLFRSQREEGEHHELKKGRKTGKNLELTVEKGKESRSTYQLDVRSRVSDREREVTSANHSSTIGRAAARPETSELLWCYFSLGSLCRNKAVVILRSGFCERMETVRGFGTSFPVIEDDEPTQLKTDQHLRDTHHTHTHYTFTLCFQGSLGI